MKRTTRILSDNNVSASDNGPAIIFITIARRNGRAAENPVFLIVIRRACCGGNDSLLFCVSIFSSMYLVQIERPVLHENLVSKCCANVRHNNAPKGQIRELKRKILELETRGEGNPNLHPRLQ